MPELNKYVKKFLKITNVQENASENHSELSPHSCYDGHYQKHRK